MPDDETIVVAPQDVPGVRHAFQLVVGGVGLLFVITAALGFYVLILARHNAHVANQTRGALCALRSDVDKRISSSRDLLELYRQGPIFGIPRAVIVSSLSNSKRTRKSLENLHC
jgi:hypothetical protein